MNCVNCYTTSLESMQNSYSTTYGSSQCYSCGFTERFVSYDEACEECPYPSSTGYQHGTQNWFQYCEAYSWRISEALSLSVVFIGAVMYLTGVLYLRKEDGSFDFHASGGLFVYTFIPALDTITDLQYVLTSQFANVYVFSLVMFFYFVPMLFFFYHLNETGDLEPIWLLRILPSSIRFDKYDNVLKILFTMIFGMPFFVIVSPVILPWAVFGIFLYMTKLYANIAIQNFWLDVWTGGAEVYVQNLMNSENKLEYLEQLTERKLYVLLKASECLESLMDDATLKIMRDYIETNYPNIGEHELVDKKVLNESIYTEIIFESLPELILQSFNNQLLREWSTVAIISTVNSALSVANGTYRAMYYKLYLGQNLVDIDVDLYLISGKDERVHELQKVQAEIPITRGDIASKLQMLAEEIIHDEALMTKESLVEAISKILKDAKKMSETADEGENEIAEELDNADETRDNFFSIVGFMG